MLDFDFPDPNELNNKENILYDLDKQEKETKTPVCERTFITCSDELTFRRNFKKPKLKPSTRNICPITRYVAYYIKPIFIINK